MAHDLKLSEESTEKMLDFVFELCKQSKKAGGYGRVHVTEVIPYGFQQFNNYKVKNPDLEYDRMSGWFTYVGH